MQFAIRLGGIATLCLALPVAAAQLDLEADAVLGKATFTSGSSAVASATNMAGASSVAEDPVSGELWVADSGFHRVLRYSSSASFANGEAANLVLGQADFTSKLQNRIGSAVPSAGSLSQPVGVAVDQAGRVYVADYSNNRVVVFRPPFTNGMDAFAVLGQADFTSSQANRGGSPSTSTLSGPSGLALDSSGNLWVADYLNHRVLRFSGPVATGRVATRLLGQLSYGTSTPATSATGMSYPFGVAIDSSDNLWVADSGNNRVLRFNQAAAEVGGDDSADGVLCQANFTASGSGTTASTCNAPVGVAVEQGGGAVYVADYYNHRILRFTSLGNGAAATAVIGQANFTAGMCNRGGTPGASTLCSPNAVAMARNGDLLSAERNAARVLRYDLPRARTAPITTTISPEVVPQGGGAFTLTVNGGRFHGGSVVNWNGAPLATQFISDRRLVAQVPASNIASSGPFAVTVTTPGPGGGTSGLVNLSTYARAPLDGVADRVLGQPNFTSSTYENPQTGEERLGPVGASTIPTGPSYVAVDQATGRLFLSDGARRRVLSWASAAAFQNAQPADIVLGQPDEFSSSCLLQVTAATLCNPQGLAIDEAGALYVSDLSNHRVLRFSPPFSTGMSADRVFGQGGVFTTNLLNNGGVSANSLYFPRALAVDRGKLFVHDSFNLRILVFDNPGADFTADTVIGQSGMSSVIAGGVSSTSVGAGDTGMAVDADGRLVLADSTRHRVIRFSPPFANGMAADLVLGQPDFASSASRPVSATSLANPMGVAFDPAGNLVVAAYSGHRVVRFLAPFTSAMAASDVVGQPDFTSFDFGTSASSIRNPSGMAMDGVGNLFVVDSGNARVLAFDRPFAFVLDPAKDLDRDGIPNGVEVTESRDPYVKDNDVFANARLFAMQQYRDFLSREGDPAGISGWTGLVTGGAYSRLQVIDAFLLSDEFAGVIAPVVRLYFATFLRVPDYAGLTFNAGLVRNGTVSLVQLADFFVASPEFQATYGALSNAQFVTLLYANVLGRAPDAAGLNGWVSLLNGGMSRGQVLAGFSESAEYQANMANEVFVTMMYAGMLRRTPEPAGFNGWVAFLDAATYTREQVINGFFLSTEYRNRFLP